jgi:hypothetical protein
LNTADTGAGEGTIPLIPSLILTRTSKKKKVMLAKTIVLLYNRQAIQTTQQVGQKRKARREITENRNKENSKKKEIGQLEP